MFKTATRFAWLLAAVFLAKTAYSQTAASTPVDSPSVARAVPSCPAILNKTFKRLQDETPQNLCQYAGKVVLVVNTASYCGFTSQYEGLEKLYADRARQGLVVLGFPSNDFGQQEPGDSKQIADFCFNTYGVKFPMFEKSAIKGNRANPLFQELAQATGKTVSWNFHKYLIDRKGKVLAHYPSSTTPTDTRLVADLNRALQTAP